MRITILGATGGASKILIEQALEAGKRLAKLRR